MSRLEEILLIISSNLFFFFFFFFYVNSLEVNLLPGGKTALALCPELCEVCSVALS